MSMVAYQLAKATHAPNLALIPFAGLVDVGRYPAGVSTAETNALESAHGFWGMDDLYEWLYQRGAIDAEIFTPAQIDAGGRINNSQVRRPDGSLMRLPGQAGIADVALLHRNLIMYVPRHSRRRFVADVDFLGGYREIALPAARAAIRLQQGHELVVTNLCQLRFDEVAGQFRVDSLHPGVSLAEVEDNTGFTLLHEPEIPLSPLPGDDVLRLIRDEIDPLGVRELEFVTSADRVPLLDAILERESVALRSARVGTS
jgi:glutaconate CoA-transferase subunit A